MKFCEDHQKHFINERGCIMCNTEPQDMSIDHALTVLSLAVISLQRDREKQERQIKFLLRELGHPDLIHVLLTPGDRPLNPNDQAIASVVETSSKTGKAFPVDPANLQFSIDNSAVASVTPLGDGTANVTAIAEGTATLTVKDTANGLAGTVGITVTSVVVTDAPDTLVVTLTPIVAGAVAAASKSGAKPVN
jgi:hypothetical protein